MHEGYGTTPNRQTTYRAPIPPPQSEIEEAHEFATYAIATSHGSALRPHAAGKFLFIGDEKLLVRGVSYGTFRPSVEGDPYPSAMAIERDFNRMAAHGINAVRTYTVPPERLLDAASQHGLWVMVGVPWEQHLTFLDDRARAASIEARIGAAVQWCKGHPAILCYAIGNEIPAPIVRWHGRHRIERFLQRLYSAVKERDPEALVTYVNYPTTEYLELPFLDLVCFNVYLEDPAAYADYLARLHHVAGNRPLVVAEIGLDSRRHGVEEQATALGWQIRTAFAGGSAGTFVFSWSDAWHRGGFDVEDWDFGLVDREGWEKPALRAVQGAYADVPFGPRTWPRVTVVVCTHNGSRTIERCLAGLSALDYPDFEVVVVDDGSNDSTPKIVERNGFRLIRTGNQGLSMARNEGLRVASGEIVAYIDDDAWPDPEWLRHLVAALESRGHAGVGGPNLPPPDGRIASCVALAPGGPTHVMLSDLEAEHIPGCSMAFWAEALREVGGFDPRFRAAGDDVDLCWRMLDRGWTLGFSPGAVVWHLRRGTVAAYWRQQEGYGRAEAQLEEKWPERYNRPGHLTWSGRLYTNARHPGWRRGRIYHGIWGSAPFQSVYGPSPGLGWWLPATPEWWLLILFLLGLGVLGFVWPPLLWGLGLAGVALAVPLAQAALGTLGGCLPPGLTRTERLRRRALVYFLHVAQPVARLRGRIRQGLTPWRRRRTIGLAAPVPHTYTVWSEQWREPVKWVRAVERALRDQGATVQVGDPHARWDLEPIIGTLGAVRVQVAVEEHGEGRQLCRLRAEPVGIPTVVGAVGALAALGGAAAADGAGWVAVALAGGAMIVLGAMLRDVASAMSAVRRATRELEAQANRAPLAPLVPRVRIEEISDPQVSRRVATR